MKSNNLLVILILCIWFLISFVTNILGPMLPIIISDFQLSLTLAAFLPFSFFLAYGITSIPAGMMIERFGARNALLLAFGLAFAGSTLFVLMPTYTIVLVSLFIIGMGMAMLQVIILPLMREAGGEKNYAFNSVLAQIVFGLASFLSPFVFSGIMHALTRPNNQPAVVSLLHRVIPPTLPWSSLYVLFTLVFAVMLLVIACVKFPMIVLKNEEKTGSMENYKELLGQKKVWFFFFGIVAYVGTEQGLANWMSQFLDHYHHIDPLTGGAKAVAWFWGLMSLGCLLGLLLVKLMDAKRVLQGFCILALINLFLALFGNREVALLAFPFCGISISVMFSIIFSLALNSMDKHHGSVSGILCTGIFGGALIPFIIGWLGDLIGLRYAMCFLSITIGYMFLVGSFSTPLVQNQTIRLSEVFTWFPKRGRR
ncbi:MFS transporter [Parapedobacter defluvii]|uniref:MFS transporter n=1 Tax=Parapedobacter defluvii TaxID=2045106 RepID=UPI0033422F2C